MNNCEMYQELISRLVDGELSREEYAAVDTHMENCAECSAMYAVFASLSDIIGGEDEALPEDLHENIMAGVRRSAMIKNNKRRLSKPVRNALAAAACAAFVLFASRGLAPEKAADAVLNKSQTAVMDAQVQEAATAPAPAAAVVSEPVPAPSETPAPAATAKPVASPKPTKDIYLENGKNEAKSAAENKNDKNNTVVVTPRPTEIPVLTPVTVNTPAPTQTPVEATNSPVIMTASPVPTEAVTEPAPTAVADAAPQQTEAPATVAAVEASAQPEAAPAEETTAVAPAKVEAVEPLETLPEETESPSLTQRIFSFFAVGRPAPASEEAPAAPAAEEIPAEAAAVAEPEEPVMFAAEPEEKEKEEENKPVRLDGVGKLFDLENLLNGVDAELPAGKADKEIRFVLMKPEAGLEDYEVVVYFYGETIYYEQIFSEEEKTICVSECKIEDFEKFMDGLSDEEKGTVPSPSPSPMASAEPAVSPAAAPASPAVEQSPKPAETADIQ